MTSNLALELLAQSDSAPLRLGNRRVTGKEQFYTPPQVAAGVVRQVLAAAPHLLGRVWLEPAGGTGSFVAAATDAGVQHIISFDIEPHHEQVRRGDFLVQRLDLQGAVAVSNPPFGRNNALSIPFFNKCAEYCDYIAFIVPRSWRKWSVQNRLDRHFHLLSDVDLSINYVDLAGQDVYAKNNLRTCVQIWERRKEPRGLIRVLDRDVIRKCRVGDADVALTIFGYGCGRVVQKFPRRTVSTQMYLRLVHPRALEALRSVDFSRFYNNVAYTEALALPEINFLLNEYLFGDPSLIDEAPREDTPALF